MPIGPFDYNSNLTSEQIKAIAEVREAYKNLHATLQRFVHPSRQMSLAVTSLEESAMWAIKGITHN